MYTDEVEIIFDRECDKCNEYFGEEYFDYDEINICKSCLKDIKNKCETCGKLGRWNFEDYEYGIRCRVHKKDDMVDTMKKEYCKKRFLKNIEKLKGKVIGEYIRNNKGIECICINGHKCNPVPNSIGTGNGMCRICTNKDQETAKLNFISNIEKLRGKIIGEYIRKDIPVDCICKNGHLCNPTPGYIRNGGGMCNRCSQSGGEINISHVLEFLNIKYKI